MLLAFLYILSRRQPTCTLDVLPTVASLRSVRLQYFDLLAPKFGFPVRGVRNSFSCPNRGPQAWVGGVNAGNQLADLRHPIYGGSDALGAYFDPSEIPNLLRRSEVSKLPPVSRYRVVPGDISSWEYFSGPCDSTSVTVPDTGIMHRIEEVRRIEVRHQYAVHRVTVVRGLGGIGYLHEILHASLIVLYGRSRNQAIAVRINEHL